MKEQEIKELDICVSQIENHEFDIARHTSMRDVLVERISAAKKSGYKTPDERFELEVAENAKRKAELEKARVAEAKAIAAEAKAIAAEAKKGKK